MRERQALVAYEQSNRTYDVHRSERLGCDLHEAWRISEVTPFGYSRRGEESPLVEQERLEEGLRIQEIFDRLDFAAFSAIVIVSETFEVTPYRALWFGFKDSCVSVSQSDRIGNGGVVSRPTIHGEPTKDTAFCARYVAMKRTLGGLIDDKQLSLRAARRHLRTHVGLLEEDGRLRLRHGFPGFRIDSTISGYVHCEPIARLGVTRGLLGTSKVSANRFRKSSRLPEMHPEY